MGEEVNPLDRALQILDLDQVDEDTFTGQSLSQLHGRVYGGQVLAQAIIAAVRTVEPTRKIHSLHGYFLRPSDLNEPITFPLQRLRYRRAFSPLRPHPIQVGHPNPSMNAS